MGKFWRKHKCPEGEEALRRAQAVALELKDYIDARVAKGDPLFDQYLVDTRTQSIVVVQELEKLIRVYGEGLSLHELEAQKQA